MRSWRRCDRHDYGLLGSPRHCPYRPAAIGLAVDYPEEPQLRVVADLACREGTPIRFCHIVQLGFHPAFCASDQSPKASFFTRKLEAVRWGEGHDQDAANCMCSERGGEVGMTQSVGYVLSASAPVLFGALHDKTGSWAPVLAICALLCGLLIILGLAAGRDRSLDEN